MSENKGKIGLNEAQRKAVEKTDGPLIILAGAGAGKTKTITYRILEIIKKGALPEQILAVTFTNKAAAEMRERVKKLLDEDETINLPVHSNIYPFVSTFHSLCVHIIKENHTRLELPRHFAIFDRSESLSAIKSAIKESSLDPKQFEPAKILSIISRHKGNGVSLADYEENATENYMDRILFVVWKKYEQNLRKEKALDFDDLLLVCKNLLAKNPEVREYYNNTWKYIHIDEYQDTNRVQYEIAKLLAEKNKNICVVGDIDQSIYSWRGADFKNLMRFEKDYEGAMTILLEENYRSTKKILRAANSVIIKNTLRKEKNLFTKNSDGENLSLYGAYDETREADFIAKKTRELINSGAKSEEIAVLYRANFQSRAIEEAFLSESLPYQVLGVRFFERKEVKDILSYLRAAIMEDNNADFRRIVNTPPRGIGKVSLLKIQAGEEEKLPDSMRLKLQDLRRKLNIIKEYSLNHKLSETIDFIIKESGLLEFYKKEEEGNEERLLNMYELVSVASKYDFLLPEKAVEQFLTESALASDQDDLKEEKIGVKLMTVHAAKGLEFDYCFISGMEEGLFPYERHEENKKKVEEGEEERRLFYVALTRARKKIYLTYAAIRTVFGNRNINMPSSFLSDIEEDILDNEISEEGSFTGKVIYLE